MILATVVQSLDPPADFAGRFVGSGVPKGQVMIIALIGLYLLPAMLAWKSGSTRRWKITAINVLLGWTVIGWIAALVLTYAFEPPPPGEVDRDYEPGTPRPQ